VVIETMNLSFVISGARAQPRSMAIGIPCSGLTLQSKNWIPARAFCAPGMTAHERGA